MADTEGSPAAVVPREEEEEREEDVESKVQSSDPAPESSDQLQHNGDAPPHAHENGTVSGGEGDVEGVGAEQQEQLVVEEEDGDRPQQQLGSRDEIKVTVTGYQRTADNCTFDVDVSPHVHKYMCMYMYMLWACV